MSIDYAPFLLADKDGRIWWGLEDAIKLGAGYVPDGADDRESVCLLIAPNDRARADEEIVATAFHDNPLDIARPQIVDRDDGHFVEARDFLGWLSQFIAQTLASVPFPDDLARAVRNAPRPAVDHPLVPPGFESLTVALEGWFDQPLSGLPEALRQRVKEDFFPVPWDMLTPHQRRSVTYQWDCHHDPAAEGDRKFWWDFFVRKEEIERQIEAWKAVDAPTASDLAKKESRLAELEKELARMKQRERRAQGDYSPEQKHLDLTPDSARSDSRVNYIAYPSAMKMLSSRLDATPEELAAWVWTGPDDGGLAAYVNANELDPPPRFFYYYLGAENDGDYLSPLMSCWFREEDIVSFSPADRHITGKALIERWNARPHLQAEAFVRAKIAESRLLDLHPIYGATRATHSDPGFPPLESGLFVLSRVEAIEAEDFARDDERNNLLARVRTQVRPDTSNWRMLVQTEAANRWTALRNSGANPTKFAIRDDLARWCRENGIKTSTGINPSADYLYRHVLRHWKPPND